MIMAERRIGPSDLAEKTGLNRVSVSRLKNSRTLPRLTEETLDKLCIALSCEPGDLIKFKANEAS